MQKSTMATPPPPPPPATSPPTSAPKINRKTMIALGVIVIIVVAIVVGVILATRGGGTGGNVAGASSLQFSADITSSGTLLTYTYSAKNIGTSNGMLRIEWTGSGSQGNTVYIINGAQQKIWVYTNGAWTDLSSYYTTYWSTWNSTFTGLRDSLASHWSGTGDYSYTDPSSGDTIRIHNINVNPSLPDSLFQHS